jgi:hypothetical protein
VYQAYFRPSCTRVFRLRPSLSLLLAGILSVPTLQPLHPAREISWDTSSRREGVDIPRQWRVRQSFARTWSSRAFALQEFFHACIIILHYWYWGLFVIIYLTDQRCPVRKGMDWRIDEINTSCLQTTSISPAIINWDGNRNFVPKCRNHTWFSTANLQVSQLQ